MNRFYALVSRARMVVLAIAGFGISADLLAMPVTEGMGLQFAQYNFTFPDAEPQPFSGYGLAAVNYSELAANTGISTGFLNIRTSAGWVVQNMPVDPASGLPGLGSMFNLGVTPNTSVSEIKVRAEFTAMPIEAFSGVPDTTFTKVNHIDYNAQGRNAPFLTAPLPLATPVIKWVTGGLTKLVWGGNRPSVEQDRNQCGPGALANSLQWLENTQPINVPHDHVPGIDGKPKNSLVGQIDVAMERQPHQTVSDQKYMGGKLLYISKNVTGRSIEIKHWGGTFVPGDFSIQVNGSTVTSVDESNSGKTLMQWIIAEIAAGEDVELALGALGGDTGHWVDVIGAGTTLGIDWIAWTHDAAQGFNADGTTANNGGVNWFDGGYQFSPIVNGQPQFFLTGMKMDFAVSESVPEPATLSLFGIALAALGSSRRRKRH